MRERKVAVVYDLGAAGPREVAEAADDLADVVFVTDTTNPHCLQMLDVLTTTAPTVDLANGFDKATAILRREGIGGITTFSESMVRITARLAQECGLPFHSPRTAEFLTDKALQRPRLNAAGVTPLAHVVIDDLTELASAVAVTGLPAVVKPRMGQASAHTYRCDDLDDVQALQADRSLATRMWVIEEMLVGRSRPPDEAWLGDYISVETAVAGNILWHYMVTDKLPLTEPFRETGDVLPSSLSDAEQERAREVAAAAISALGIRIGLVHTELKLTTDGPKVIEVNGRLGGDLGRLLRHGAQFDPVRLALEIALGIPIVARPVLLTHPVIGYSVFPPIRRVRIRSIAPPSHFRRIPGVWAVDRPVRSDTVLDWRSGSREAVFVLWLEAVDLNSAPSVVAAVQQAATTCVEYVAV